MSIKIYAEKLAVMDDHKTRKYNLKNSTQSSKVLINKATHIMLSVNVANKIFSKMDLPYMKDVNIGFYSPEKIILQTENDILRAKVKELHPQFLRILKKQKMFSKLEKIDINIVSKEKVVEKKPDIETKKQIEKLKRSLKY